MKIMFVLMCVVVALLAGFVAFTLQSGRLVFNPLAAESAELAQQNEPVIGSQVGLVEELITSLQSAREEVESQMRELDKREADLQAREAAYNKIRTETASLMSELEDRIVKVKQNDLKNSKQLASVYSKMDPSAAAQAFRNMDNERVALVLSQMDGRSMAAIMSAAVTSTADGSQYVAEWSESIRRMTEEKDGL